MLSTRSDAAPYRAWNKDHLVGPKLALKPQQVWSVRFISSVRDERETSRCSTSQSTAKLRGCDLVRLRISDMLAGGVVRSRALIVQQKTGTAVWFEVTQGTRNSVLAWIRERGSGCGDCLFPSRRHDRDCISTRHYARLLKRWLRDVGIEPSAYGTHSLRRTKVALIYCQTGNIRAIQILLGHSELDSTVRHLGVDIEDALALAEGTDL